MCDPYPYPNPRPEHKKKKGRSGGEKFGIALGVILLLAAVGAGGFFLYKKFRKSGESAPLLKW